MKKISKKRIVQTTAMLVLGALFSISGTEEVSAATPQFELTTQNTVKTINMDEVIVALDGKSSRDEDENGSYIEYTVKDHVIRFYLSDKNIVYVNGLQESFETKELADGTVLPNESNGAGMTAMKKFEVPVEFAKRLLDLQVIGNVATLSSEDNDRILLAKSEAKEEALERQVKAKEKENEERILAQQKTIEALEASAKYEATKSNESSTDESSDGVGKETNTESEQPENTKQPGEKTEKEPAKEQDSKPAPTPVEKPENTVPKEDVPVEKPEETPQPTVTIADIKAVAKMSGQKNVNIWKEGDYIYVQSFLKDYVPTADGLTYEDQRDIFQRRLAEAGYKYDNSTSKNDWKFSISVFQ